MASPKVSVVIPCYNEEKRFSEGFDHYYSYLKKQKYSYELILVNDGSNDKTLTLMRKASEKSPSVKIVTYEKNRGKGYAITKGIMTAKGQHILFSDLDHSVPIDTLESFFPYFNHGCDLVIGSRRAKGAKIVVHQKPLREWLGRGFTFLVNLLVIWGIRDATCGFKAFRNNVAKKTFRKLRVYGWAFDAEILFIAKKMNFKIAQAPVRWSDVKGSKVALKKDILGSLKGLIQIRIKDILGRYD